MLDVHGIAVSGPTFPATIWRLFMEKALDAVPPHDWPTPSVYPVWHSFTHAQYARRTINLFDGKVVTENLRAAS